MRRWRATHCWLCFLAILVACGSEDSAPPSTSSAGGSGGFGQGGSGGGGSASGGSSTSGGGGTVSGGSGGVGAAGGAAASVTVAQISDHHRFIDGKMFGGWGPHLGHLVRAKASSGNGQSLWLVDDYCAQPGDMGGGCDVLSNHSLGYFERKAAGWKLAHVVAIGGGVQQNTATIALGDTLYSYGVDVAASRVRECAYSTNGGPLGCAPLPFVLPASSNYVGAAVSPKGYRMVWWTNVVDGGGGGFHFIVDYGGGWNGPRSGDAGGYNDASYINIGFGAAGDPNKFVMHVQLVSGLAPNWGFLGAVGYGDISKDAVVTWANALAAPSNDKVASTNDVWIDPANGDAHLVARSAAGAAVYYHLPAGGSWSAPAFALPATYRARFVFDANRLVLIYGPNPASPELAYRVAAAADRPAGKPIAWDKLAEHPVDLPDSTGQIYAIYPESAAYQSDPAQGIHVAVVGSKQQSVVTHVAIE